MILLSQRRVIVRNRAMKSLLAPGISIAFLVAIPVGADVVHLVGGGTIEGKVTDFGDEVRIQRGSGSMTIPKSRVVRIDCGPTKEDQYAERAKALDAKDVKGHLALAVWCRGAGLSDPARAEYEKVLSVDPDHEEARHALGHEQVDGRWMTFEEAQRTRGLVLYKGRWITVEERDVRVALEAGESIHRAALDQVRQLLQRAALAPDVGQREEARRRLAEFSSEDRRLPCMEALGSSESRVRAAAAASLATASDPPVVAALARRFVYDASPEVRQAASNALTEMKAPTTGAVFLDLFQRGGLGAQIRAAEGLAAFPEPKAVPALIAALAEAMAPPEQISLTTVGPGCDAPPGPIVIPGGRVITPPATPPGRSVRGGTLPPTQGLIIPRVLTSIPIKRSPAEEAARRALAEACVRALKACTGKDHGSDASAWKSWWLRETVRTPASGGAKPAGEAKGEGETKAGGNVKPGKEAKGGGEAKE
jgi:hypothetical protein